jgi:hypothetical protein
MSRDFTAEMRRPKQGDHVCLIYDDPEDQLAAATAFVAVGLARQERCLYIADDRTTAEVIDAMIAAGIDVGRRLEAGSVEFLTKRESYLRRGHFDPSDMLVFLQEAAERALKAGYTGLRATGEMTWALGAERGCERLIEYEVQLDDCLRDSRAVALCQYNERRCRSSRACAWTTRPTSRHVSSGGRRPSRKSWTG